MHIYQLEFTDGKSCTHIIPRPDCSEEEEIRTTAAIFCGRLASMTRIITPPPTKLPWKPERKGVWTLGLFILERIDPETFKCTWPDGEVIGDKDEISASVRLHWSEGVLT